MTGSTILWGIAVLVIFITSECDRSHGDRAAVDHREPGADDTAPPPALRYLQCNDVSPALADFIQRAPIHPDPNIPRGRAAETQQALQVADIKTEQGYIERDPLAVTAVELMSPGLPRSDTLFADIERRLADFDELRLEPMDKGGTDLAVLSVTTPGVQAESNTKVAIRSRGSLGFWLPSPLRRDHTAWLGSERDKSRRLS